MKENDDVCFGAGLLAIKLFTSCKSLRLVFFLALDCCTRGGSQKGFCLP